MTHEEQIESDLVLYGIAVERKLEDGTIERIDPKSLKFIYPKSLRFEEDKKAYMPVPVVTYKFIPL